MVGSNFPQTLVTSLTEDNRLLDHFVSEYHPSSVIKRRIVLGFGDTLIKFHVHFV